jgi:lipopolysaccharide transport system ATP-binding protein
MFMSDIVIRVENLSKRYTLRHEIHDGSGLRHVLHRKIVAPLRWLARDRRQTRSRAGSEPFWALHDVSFDVKRGETLGIIGRNGAGKSTLLKILARITEPTGGRVRIKGRVGSLLEVGTGFHPELSGRENIYLNGAILGMSGKEIRSKFDEIVAFADVERFLDTPVKHYSSGMYVRLAFAVAAHLDPEILIVDEVLAVGDVQFQQKCLGKMEEVAAREGRTVLFVSHNMGAIQALCHRGICIESGTIAVDTGAIQAVNFYLKGFEQGTSADLLSVRERSGKGEIRLARVDVLSETGERTAVLTTGKRARFVFHVSGVRPKTVVNFLLYDMKGNSILILNSENRGPRDCVSSELQGSLICDIDKLPLLPGRYGVHVNVGCGDEHQDSLSPAAIFDVVEGLYDGRREAATPFAIVATSHRWTIPADSNGS